MRQFYALPTGPSKVEIAYQLRCPLFHSISAGQWANNYVLKTQSIICNETYAAAGKKLLAVGSAPCWGVHVCFGALYRAPAAPTTQ